MALLSALRVKFGGDAMTEDDVPECPSGEGHAWVAGKAKMNGLDEIEIVTVQCRRCGVEDSLGGSA